MESGPGAVALITARTAAVGPRPARGAVIRGHRASSPTTTNRRRGTDHPTQGYPQQKQERGHLESPEYREFPAARSGSRGLYFQYELEAGDQSTCLQTSPLFRSLYSSIATRKRTTCLLHMVRFYSQFPSCHVARAAEKNVVDAAVLDAAAAIIRARSHRAN
ncbi:unnamed protein product [Ixodes pacificus]